jgi:hypothetical protein
MVFWRKFQMDVGCDDLPIFLFPLGGGGGALELSDGLQTRNSTWIGDLVEALIK